MTGTDWQELVCIAGVSVCAVFIIRYLWRGGGGRSRGTTYSRCGGGVFILGRVNAVSVVRG